MIGQSANVMMRLDHSRFSESALNDIGIDCPLHEEIHRTDLARSLLKDADKLLADDLALLFWLRYGP